jgi:hypothetical protein
MTAEKETTQAPKRTSLFAAPDQLLKLVDDLIRNHSRRTGITLELFEMQHQLSQEAYESWVLKRLQEKFE